MSNNNNSNLNPTKNQSMKILLTLASVAVLLAGCTRDVQFTVVNDSTATLTNITVAGSRFTNSVGSLAPGAQQHVPLQNSSGEFTLDFDANGKHFSEPSPKDPWNGMKEIIMTVATNFTITCDGVTTF